MGCGLVMKEDITQLCLRNGAIVHGCGLVMKEDITQLDYKEKMAEWVVVW